MSEDKEKFRQSRVGLSSGGSLHVAEVDTYVEHLRAAGVTHLEHGAVGDVGHFVQAEPPEETWKAING